MSSHSPQRNRRALLSGSQGSMQNISPRELTPSPSFRERNRAIKAHSMPIVPAIGLSQQPSPTTSNSSHQSRRSPPPTSRISPVATKMSTTIHPRDRTPDHPSTPPPLAHSHSQPVVPHLGASAPPPLSHMQSQPNVLSHMSQTQHQPRPMPRVLPPPFLTQYQSADDKWHVTEELMAEIERADLQQAQGQFSHPAGTSGVAYAGGIASSGGSLHLQHSVNAAAKDPTVERVRASDRASPKDDGNSSASKRLSRDKDRDVQISRESPKARERAHTVSSVSSYADAQTTMNRTPEYRGSPQYTTPLGSPGERSATYTQYIPDAYQTAGPQVPTPPAARKPGPAQGAALPDTNAPRLTPPASTKLASHTPPLQAVRPPDRSLPVQEEPEEDLAHEYLDRDPDFHERQSGSPTPSSDLYPEGHGSRYDARRDQGVNASRDDRDDDDDETLDEETLNEEVDDHLQAGKGSTDSEAFTPRSPSAALPERPRESSPYNGGSNGSYVTTMNGSNGPYVPVMNGQYNQIGGEHQKTIRAKHRIGSTDQLGMRTFDPAMFENTMNSLRGNDQGSASSAQRQYLQKQQQQQQQQQSQQPQPQILLQNQLAFQEEMKAESMRQYVQQQTAIHSVEYARAPSQRSDDTQSLFEDPTSSYIQSYLRSPNSRPDAPIPPTPHSQTAAPSPSPLVSAMPSDVEPRQIGSPYPYPFTHIRRSTISAPMQAPSSSYDMNNPAVIREQLALQMQIYALNNGLAPSDSTFSPSSTPFPGAGYNPWTYVPMMGGGGAAEVGGSNMSMRSSPSHEPVQLPLPPMRGRGLRHRENTGSLRVPQGAPRPARRVKPPPRVESTQPRETSPEPSSGSGEETAGEEHFVAQYATTPESANGWNNGNGNGIGLNGNRGENGNGNVRVNVNGHVNGNSHGNAMLDSPQTDDSGEWVDEEDDDEEDLLQLEFHPTFVSNAQKRRRRFDTCWDALTRAFQALDRETDSTLVLLASPPHSSKLHALTSRSIRRDPSLSNSPALDSMRSSFHSLASQRRAARSISKSLAEQLSPRALEAMDGSSEGSGSREEELKRALEAALGSLNALGNIYDQRESRWRDEMRRLNEDRERVELLLKQTLGPAILHANDNVKMI